MRYFSVLLLAIASTTGFSQVCPEQSEEINIANWTVEYGVPYLDGDLYLDAVNEPQYQGAWSIGTGISNSNLMVLRNDDISAFIGVKKRNVVAPNDDWPSTGNVYGIEPGYSPESLGSTNESTLSSWNVIFYVNLGNYTFADVDVRLYIDFNGSFGNGLSEMLEIPVAEQMIANGLDPASFTAFGTNQNLASNLWDFFDDPNVLEFDPLAEGFYSMTIAIYDACGNSVASLETLSNQSEDIGSPDSDNDGIPDSQEVDGCTQPDACNFNVDATQDDGSCTFDENPLAFDAVLNLTDDIADWATNEYFTMSNGSSVSHEDYAGRLTDGRYSVTRIYSTTSTCGNPISCGQLLIADATQPSGCTNALATNYDSNAVNDDGTCSFDPSCLGDLNEDTIVGATDLLILLSAFGLPCPQ